MSRWLSVTPLQEPFDAGVDNGMATYAVNALVLKEPSDTFLLEVIGLLVAAGVGTFGVDIFGGSDFDVPTDRATLAVTATGGLAPLRTQTSKYKRPAVQLFARGPDTVAAEALCQAAIAAIADVQNQDVTPAVP